MNKAKKTTFWDRLKAAARAFKGKPVSSLTRGLHVKRCDECERGDCTKCDYKREFARGYAPRVGGRIRINCVPEKEE